MKFSSPEFEVGEVLCALHSALYCGSAALLRPGRPALTASTMCQNPACNLIYSAATLTLIISTIRQVHSPKAQGKQPVGRFAHKLL